jgi:hypothetical protein
VVRDSMTGNLGSALHTFEVPAATGLRLSSPILSDQVDASGIPRLLLRLDRHYLSGTALYCQYRVFGAALDATKGTPRVSASYAVARGGHIVQEGLPSMIEPTRDGQLVRLLGFGLAAFEPGDYTLTLRITDEVSGERREVVEPFIVIPAHG